MPYRFVIIGCGRIAERHAQQIAQQGVLVALADINLEKAKKLAGKKSVNIFDDAKSLLIESQADVAVICTPNGLHASQSILALENGYHVLCEKPMALKVSDAEKMISAAMANNRKLYVVKQNRFNPPVTEVKKLLDENKLGKLLSFQMNCFWNRTSAYYKDDWRGTLDLDGGTLFTQFSHFIDLLYWFTGSMEKAQGWRQNLNHKEDIAFEDQGQLVLKMSSGLTGSLNYTVNSFQKNMEGSLTLFGEKGTVRIGGQYLNTLEYFSVEGCETPLHLPQRAPNNYGDYEGSMSNHDKVYVELIKALEGKEHKLVNAEDALKTIEIIESIYQQIPLVP